MAAPEAPLNSPGALLRPALLLLPALAAYWLPALASTMVYDRAAILDGEIWRLVTGHWVHFSARQLLCDGAVFGFFAWSCERLGFRHLPLVCLLSAPGIAAALLLCLPEMAFFGGLSGLALTGTVLTGLLLGKRDGAPSRLGSALLVLVLTKLVLELAGSPLVAFGNAGARFVTVPLAHLLGGCCGVLAFALGRPRHPSSVVSAPCSPR